VLLINPEVGLRRTTWLWRRPTGGLCWPWIKDHHRAVVSSQFSAQAGAANPTVTFKLLPPQGEPSSPLAKPASAPSFAGDAAALALAGISSGRGQRGDPPLNLATPLPRRGDRPGLGDPARRTPRPPTTCCSAREVVPDGNFPRGPPGGARQEIAGFSINALGLCRLSVVDRALQSWTGLKGHGPWPCLKRWPTKVP